MSGIEELDHHIRIDHTEASRAHSGNDIPLRDINRPFMEDRIQS